MKLIVEYDAELQMPRVQLIAETEQEDQDLELMAAFDDLRFSYEINKHD